MDEIPEGFEPFTDEDGDEWWVDKYGDQQYVGPTGELEPDPSWKRLYIGPPPPKPRSLEDKVRDLAVRFDRLALQDGVLPDPGRSNAWRDAADDLRGLLDVDDQ